MGTMYVVKRVLGSITSVLKGPGSAGPLEVENSGTLPVNVYFKTTNPGDTQVAAASPMPVTAASLPLPTGAATSALQGGGLPAALGAGGGLKVDGSGTAIPVSGTFWQATQPVSGTVTANQGTAGAGAWPVSIDQTTPGTTDRVTVGGTTVIAQTPTVTVGAYTAKDAVGGKLTFALAARVAAGSGVIQSVTIVDDAAQSAELVLALYGADFTATADNAAFDPSDADNENLIGHVKVAATDYQAFADNAVATKTSIGLAFKLASGQSIYGQLMCTGTPTYAAVGDLTVKLGILQQD